MLATEALKGMHAAAEAELAAADGDVERAVQQLRRSVQHWREAGCRVGEAEARLRLAECLLDDGDAAGSELELHAVESRLASAALAHRGRIDALRLALHPLPRTLSS
jgi:thioredoxin-like negative regulator of GroEL